MCLLGLENLESLGPDPANPQKALIVKLPDGWSRATPVFDEENLVSCAGLVPLMGLAEQAGLSALIEDKVMLRTSGVASAGGNPAGEVGPIQAGVAADAARDDFVGVISSGGGGA